ncbi:MAG TPA: hypothetical protein VFL96_10805, partial [Acidobacteriaceae bacterium]|nr:hypothetical protein [Acidobacteriaceae bacterium]
MGLSITACQTPVGDYCNGIGYGAKKDQVAAIDLEPKTTGLSLAWGQTAQLGLPQATSCGEGGTPVSVAVYYYGSSNLQLADISPNGEVCGGTWNRNSPGGIQDYTICTPPSGSSGGTCTSTSCGVVNLTATAAGVTSNPVQVYIHPPITSISIDPNSSVESQCYSQNTSGPVLTPLGSSPTVTVLGPNGQPIDPADVGTISYKAITANIVNINNTSATGTGVNGATTANMPGATVINATVSKSSSGSAAGYFYTCPPKSIALSVIGNHTGDGVNTPISITSGLPINLSATVTDTRGQIINGLSLDYTSTSPENI